MKHWGSILRTKNLGLIAILIAFAPGGRLVAGQPESRLYDFNVHVNLHGLNELPVDNQPLNLWLPLLPATDYQQIEEISIGPSNGLLTQGSRYNNGIIHFSFKPPFESDIAVNVRYKIRRFEQTHTSTVNAVNTASEPKPTAPSNYLSQTRLVTISPRIQDKAARIVAGKKNTMDKARAIYDYVFENMAYDKSIPGYGFGDTERACDIGAGNCTDFHSLFISLSRASNIPAKFVIGVPLSSAPEGELSKYHCWAEFYDEDSGWVPVDISEAAKDKSKKDYHFGAVDMNRLEFSHGRDIILEPAQSGEPLNYFVFPYAELDGKQFEQLDVLFTYQDIDQQIPN